MFLKIKFNMKYKINHANLKQCLSSSSPYNDLVYGLARQFLESGTLNCEVSFAFLLDAKILEEDKEVAANG